MSEAPGRRKRHTVVGLAFLAAFICYIDRTNISVAILGMQEQYGWGAEIKGYILSAFFAGYLLFMLPSGWLVNRHGGKRTLGFAVLWWSFFTMVTPLAAAISLPMLLIARFGMGLGEAFMFPAGYALFGRWVPSTERSRAVGFLLSGVPVGTLFALTTTGALVTMLGWPSSFYLFGAVGLAWAAVWYASVSDDPYTDPAVSEQERKELREGGAAEKPPETIPWRLLLASPAVWALVINHFCSNWTLYLVLAWLPSYFREVHHLSITGAGLYSAAPWLTMFVVINLSGAFADRLIRDGADVTVVRKSFQTCGLVGSACFLWLAQGAGSPIDAVVLMCAAMGALALTWAGFGPAPVELAPRYAGVLMSISNTAGTVPGIVGVALTGWLVQGTGSYTSAFVLAGAISVFGAIVWLLFGTGKRVVD